MPGRRPRGNLDLFLKPDLVQDNVPALVVDRVWVGSIHAAFNQEALHDRGITHVLNASGLPATFPRSFTYFGVDLRDKEEVNILGAIGAANIFIDAGVEKGGVLVHCAGGRSRSAAFVVAYIMSTLGYTYDQAYDVLKAARPVVSINRGFEMQLRAYGATGCDLHASHQMMLRARLQDLLERRQRSAAAAGKAAAATALVASARRKRFSADAGSPAARSPQAASKEAMYLLSQPRPARLRLSRPGSSSVQVVPPLSNLEGVYACRKCGAHLFTGASIIRTDISDLPDISLIAPSPLNPGGSPVVGGQSADAAVAEGNPRVGGLHFSPPPHLAGDIHQIDAGSEPKGRWSGSLVEVAEAPRDAPRSTRHQESKLQSFAFDMDDEEPGAKGAPMDWEEPLAGNAATTGILKNSVPYLLEISRNSAVTTPRTRTPMSCTSDSPGNSDMSACASLGGLASPESRPQSVERKRSLARMHLLAVASPDRDSPNSAAAGKRGSLTVSAQGETTPDGFMQLEGPWVQLEHLPWMGDIFTKSVGSVVCPNATCHSELGEWTWEASTVPKMAAVAAPNSPALLPAIVLHKSSLKPTGLSLSRIDSRASMSSRESTPRDGVNGNVHVGNVTPDPHVDLRRGSGVLESKFEALCRSQGTRS